MGFDHSRRKARKDRRDFWRAWKDEQRRIWHERTDEPWSPDFPPPHELAQAWREFFHTFMGDWPEGHWMFGNRRFSPWLQGVAAFNPFVASLMSKGGGLLALYVLHLVSEKPRYGNEIMDLIAERTGGQWVSNPGAIYPLLTELEQQGLIEGLWEDPQKRTIRLYSLTHAGEQDLVRLRAVVAPKLQEAVDVLKTLMKDLNGDDTPEDQDASDEPGPDGVPPVDKVK